MSWGRGGGKEPPPPPGHPRKSKCGAACDKCEKYGMSPPGTCRKDDGHGYSHLGTCGHSY